MSEFLVTPEDVIAASARLRAISGGVQELCGYVRGCAGAAAGTPAQSLALLPITPPPVARLPVGSGNARPASPYEERGRDTRRGSRHGGAHRDDHPPAHKRPRRGQGSGTITIPPPPASPCPKPASQTEPGEGSGTTVIG